MSEHTPGKWEGYRVWYEGENKPRSLRVQSGGKLVANVYPKTTAAGEANARLIAAAPDLLEACKALLAEETVHLHHWTCPASHVIANVCDCHVHKMKAAIARAEGKTP